jgi:hypothetical protein
VRHNPFFLVVVNIKLGIILPSKICSNQTFTLGGHIENQLNLECPFHFNCKLYDNEHVISKIIENETCTNTGSKRVLPNILTIHQMRQLMNHSNVSIDGRQAVH